MKLLNNYVMVEKIIKDKTESGILLAESQKDKQIGRVVKIGNKVKFVKVGDTVKYYEHAGTKITYRGDDLLILNELGEISVIL